jgi:hypothetical protein
MTHSLHGGGNTSGKNIGFAALSKSIGTPKSTDQDSAYVTEHPVLKYFRAKLANFLNDFRRADWFDRFGLPVSRKAQSALQKSGSAADAASGAAYVSPGRRAWSQAA